MRKFRLWITVGNSRVVRDKELPDDAMLLEVDNALQVEIEDMLSRDLVAGVEELDKTGNVIDTWVVHSNKE